MIRIIIADDSAMVRAGLRERLAPRGSISIVAEADDGDKLLAIVGEVAADVLLLDVSMPGPGFLNVLARVRAAAPAIQVLALAMQPEDPFAARALKAGASGFLAKVHTPDELLEAVTRIARGGRHITPRRADRLASQPNGTLTAAPHDKLSGRELEVLLLLGGGETVKQAAEHLRLSMKTVSTFRRRLLRKMQFTTNADIVQYVAGAGLLPPDEVEERA